MSEHLGLAQGSEDYVTKGSSTSGHNYNNAGVNKAALIKEEANIEQGKIYLPLNDIQNINNEDVELDIKEDIEINDEPIQSPDIQFVVKGNIEVDQEPLDFTTETKGDDRPYQCRQCDKVFSENCNLTNHLRTHT